ncbi:MAG TPA: chemotaxis protein CheW [Geobacteraceae bacterium]|nr:chemotaxis protein CheW [Geobacteraceae bacterium]
MIFRLHGRRFVLEVDSVAEISDVLPEYPIPGAPPFLRGVVNMHGRVAAVLDLGLYLGLGPTDKGRSLVLLSGPESSLALLVEHLERMIVSEDIGAIQTGNDRLLPVELVLADGRASLLDVAALMDAVEKSI